MSKIQVLDQNMINIIAAGEVIERPASVVKELTENSIDSGATQIDIKIEAGGTKLISIADNGCGMEADDLERAFEPHATSKIKVSDDLNSIATLGFRGEALASIASVASVKAVSRIKESDSGNRVEIDCGDNPGAKPCSADVGTIIEVRDLFYKMPARRKFLRTVNTEMSHITEQFIRIALANIHLGFTLCHNGREIYSLSADQSIRERVAMLFSEDIAQGLIQTESNEKNMNIFALLGRPDISKTNNKLQYVFLNGRFIRDKFISHAMREAYRSFLESDRYGVVFLYIKMPFEDYDVNVHPTKTEVRFYNANLVHSQVLAVLREKLMGSDHTVGKIPTGNVPIESTQARTSKGEHKQRINDAMADFFKKHRPAQKQSDFNFSAPRLAATVPQVSNAEKPEPLHQQQDVQVNLPQRQYLQIHDSYIVTQTKQGFEIVDQHALHERILYNKLKQRVTEAGLQSQKLLLPESFQATVQQTAAFSEFTEIIEKLGLEVVSWGPKTLAVQSFPILLAKANPVEFVQDMLDVLADKGKGFDAEQLLDEVINMAACKAAIKAGDKLNEAEIEQLLADRDNCPLSGRCAHGRPTSINFTISELEKQFKRT